MKWKWKRARPCSSTSTRQRRPYPLRWLRRSRLQTRRRRPVTPGTQVKSPLPGTVLKVNVAVGDAVKAGDVLMIIEAMKMENEIAAPSDGTVKQIAKEKGATVVTGDVLLVI